MLISLTHEVNGLIYRFNILKYKMDAFIKVKKF